MIDLARIRPDPAQPRKNLETDTQRELEDSVRQLGILQPITVRYLPQEDVYQIISGERRYQGAKKAALTEIPCWVQNPKEADILLHQIVENWQRAELHPYELADALACLRDSNGYSQKQLASLTGKPESEISRLLSLLTLRPEVQRDTRDDATGAFTKRHLTAMAQLPPEDQQEVMIAVRKKRLTAIDTERAVKEIKSRATGDKSRGAPLGQRLRYLTAKATVTLSFRRRAVTVTDILTALDEARDQVRKTARDEGSSR